MSNPVTENRTVTSQEARAALLRCFKVQQPVMLWGPAGIGKSDLVASITEDLGGIMYDLRLSQMEPTDLRGIPYFNKEKSVMDWAPPIDLPDEETAARYPVVVLFLDELNSGAPSVQAAAYQLVLNRRIGKYKLPKNTVIVAAGNRDGDKGVTYRMPAPLANRMSHLEMRVDFESWLIWAAQHDINRDVIGYLNFAKSDLNNFDPKSSSRAFATPRSWTFVSALLDPSLADSTVTDLVAGTVGEGIAIKFMAHRKIGASLPNPEDILSGKVKDLDVKEISAMYSLATGMCYELKDQIGKLGKARIEDWHKMADNFFEYMMKNFTTEVTVMAARMALTIHNLPFVPNKLKSFDAFHKRFGKYIVAAVN